MIKSNHRKRKGRWVHVSMLGQDNHCPHSSLLSLHYPEREICAARFPASRGALLSNTQEIQPSGRISAVTPGLKWTDYRHATGDPQPRAPCPHLPAPAQVTGGRYTSQLADRVENLSCKLSSDLLSKSYGLMHTLLCSIDSHPSSPLLISV